MVITKLTSQIKNPDRINVFGDDVYVFSLDISQVIDLKVKVGNEYSEEEIEYLKREAEFGKYYNKALMYSFVRPRSIKEMKDYLWRQTQKKPYRVDGRQVLRDGMSRDLIERILDKLIDKKYINDEEFARYWVDNRNVHKGISQKVLRLELKKKGVEDSIVELTISSSGRSDLEELKKIFLKKSRLYADESKFIKYLLNKGYLFGDIKEVLAQFREDAEEGVS